MIFSELLKSNGACDEACEWVAQRDIATAYAECERADWLLWIFGRMADKLGWPTRKQVVLAACACAESALKHVKPGEDRPRKAIETARAWVRGEATIEQVRSAAADAASAAAADAYAAAAAAAASAAYAYAAAAAAAAAASAASAAYARAAAYAYARAAAYAAAAKKSSHIEMCSIVRSMLPCPTV